MEVSSYVEGFSAVCLYLDHECARTSHHSFSHALDYCSHDVSIRITSEFCPRAASYPPRYLLEGRLTIAQLEQVNPWSTPDGVACSVRAIAASSGRSELTPSSSRPTRTLRYLLCCWRHTLPAPMTPLCADPSPAHVSPGKL